MITIRYHPQLIEQAVWLAAREDAATDNALHRDIDPIYEGADDGNREARFQHVFREWFKRLRLDRPMDEALAHFPCVVERLAQGVVRLTPRRKSQGAEMFVARDGDTLRQTLVVQVCAESMVDFQSIRELMLRDLQHVEDMLDEHFGYTPESLDGLPAHQRVMQDRYRVLWDIRVEVSLYRRGLVDGSRERPLWRLFERAFTVGDDRPTRGLFEQVWQADHLAHAQLFAWARDPRAWLRGHAGGAPDARHTMSGEPCPLCRFPTFDWYDFSGEPSETVARIQRHQPDWQPNEGACRQCAETYLASPPPGEAVPGCCA